MDRPDGRRVLKFDGLSGRGLWYRPSGDEFYNAAFGGPPPPLRGPPPPRRAVGGKFEGRGLLSPPTKWDRQGLRQRSSPPCYLPTPFPGVGGERSETEGGGWMGHSAARVQRVAVAASPQVFYNAAFGTPPPPLRGPPPPTSGGRQV